VETPKIKKLGLFDLLSASLGMTIGAGIVTMIGPAIAETGRSAWLAYAFAVLLGFLNCLPFALQARLVYTPGGYYSLVADMLGQPLGAFTALAIIPSTMQLALYSAGVVTYVKVFVPGVNTKILATVITVVFLVLNLAKLDIFKRIQNVMFAVLLLSLGAFIVFGFTKINYPLVDFSDTAEFITNGSAGFWAATMILLYSTNTYKAMLSYGGIAENPKKNIPLTICLTPLVLLAFYCGVAIVDSCVLPVEQTAGQSLVSAASAVLPRWMFIIFIIGGCVMAMFTTINAAMKAYSQQFLKVAEDNWLPGFLGKINKNGQPVWMLTLVMCIALAAIWADMSINEIANNVVLIQFTYQLLPIICNYLLPTRHPECWEASGTKMSKGVYYLLNTIGLIATIIVIIGSASGITTTAIILSIVALVAILAYCFLRYKSGVTKNRYATW